MIIWDRRTRDTISMTFARSTRKQIGRRIARNSEGHRALMSTGAFHRPSVQDASVQGSSCHPDYADVVSGSGLRERNSRNYNHGIQAFSELLADRGRDGPRHHLLVVVHVG